jgi:hypothetical protein
MRVRSASADRWLVAFGLALAFGTARAELLLTTNQNPFLATAGIPGPLPAVLERGETRLDAILNWGSTAIIDTTPEEILVADVEMRELRLGLTHTITPRLSLRVELPYVYSGPGVLDGFIDDFHDAFGFSEGDRPLFRRDSMLVWYLRSSEGSLVRRTTSMEGIGDLRVALGSQWLRSARTAVSTWVSVEAPTGTDDAYLAADDDWNFTATAAVQHRLARRWLAFAQASATTHTGDGVFGAQRPVIWSSLAGVQFEATRRVALTVQAQAHTRPLDDTDLKYLRNAVVLTVGGQIRAADSLDIHLGLSEDVKVEASPDAVFVLGVTSRW